MHKALTTLIPAAALFALGACSYTPPETLFGGKDEPVVQRITADHAQELAWNHSLLGKACKGSDPMNSIKLSGHSRYHLLVDIHEVRNGQRTPFNRGAAPANRGISKFAQPEFSGARDPVSCSGMALRTSVTKADGQEFLEYDLEFAPEAVSEGAGPVLIRGDIPMSAGYGAQQKAFKVGERAFIAELKAAPGPAWPAPVQTRATTYGGSGTEAEARRPENSGGP